jgi:hypothetical protein
MRNVLLVRKCEEIRGSTGSIADDDGHGGRGGDVFQNGANRVRPALDYQAHQRSAKVTLKI